MARTAVVAGVGPGLGESLARRFAAEECRVALFARSTDYIEEPAETYWHLIERDDVGTQPFEVHVAHEPNPSEFI